MFAITPKKFKILFMIRLLFKIIRFPLKIIFIIILVLAVLFLILSLIIGPHIKDIEQSPVIFNNTSNNSKPSNIKPSSTSTVFEKAVVTRVIDGDTIELQSGERVRYIGVNTPDFKDLRKKVQCFATEAFEKNKEIIANNVVNNVVFLEKDISERDKYNRLLRYVYVSSDNSNNDSPKIFVNLELIKQGYAYATRYLPDIKYSDLFKVAQAEAKTDKRGLWGKCR